MIVGLTNHSEKLLWPKKQKLLWEWAQSWRFEVQESPNHKLTRLTHYEVDTVKFAFHQIHKATSRTKRKIACPATDPISQISGWRELRGVGTWCSWVPNEGAEQLWKVLREALKPFPKQCKAPIKGFHSPQPVMNLKKQQKLLPISYTFHSPVKPVASPLPLAELWIYQEQTSVTTVCWDHPSAAENASMHSVNIRRSGVTCFYQLTKSTSIQPEWKVILRYCAIHWQGTAQNRTNTAEAAGLLPALLWLQKSSHSLW